ncbi:uncharacterized protein F5Z01DRAFT_362443 [Emericellopsis atlantica]|uniref:Secreted protein n=1 Tax=Emericellopsis atlantica TaxID=2614577 RepID=A0A9P7ZF63_9HYPO|nr:uncharacterized protein F5Z01DRAFT_362443 [Emericellopsis atlantica]KAG9250445.1 hypothetical protein F5Z01DRAFT_362443 [Emericellopsis atlantica]
MRSILRLGAVSAIEIIGWGCQAQPLWMAYCGFRVLSVWKVTRSPAVERMRGWRNCNNSGFSADLAHKGSAQGFGPPSQRVVRAGHLTTCTKYR